MQRAAPPVMPREHGGWGILILSIALAVGVRGAIGLPVLLFLVAGVAIFLARYPLALLVKGQFSRKIVAWLAIYLGVGLAAFLPLLLSYRLWWLAALGAVYLLYLAAYLYITAARKQRTEWGEMIGISGLTLAAPTAFYVSDGSWQTWGLYLWLLAFLYHASSVFFVPLKVKHRLLRQLPASVGAKWQLGHKLLFYLLALLVIVFSLSTTHRVPLLAIVAYLPLAVKSIWATFLPSRVASIRRLGWLEAAHGFVFTGLMVAAYHVPG